MRLRLKQYPSHHINQLTGQSKHIKPITAKRKRALVKFDLFNDAQNTAPNGFKYLLKTIDVWRRYSWLILLKNPTSKPLVLAFKEWLNKTKTNRTLVASLCRIREDGLSSRLFLERWHQVYTTFYSLVSWSSWKARWNHPSDAGAKIVISKGPYSR